VYLFFFSLQGVSYRFQIIPLSTEPPVGFEQPNFDDSEFETGGHRLGRGCGAPGGTDCPLHRTVQTQWPAESQLLVRTRCRHSRWGDQPQDHWCPSTTTSLGCSLTAGRSSNTPLALPVSIMRGCPILDEFRFDVPPRAGTERVQNLVAFHVVDRGAESFFDAKFLRSLAPDALSQALDRASSTVNLMIPIEPVSNITSMCNSFDGRNVALCLFF